MSLEEAKKEGGIVKTEVPVNPNVSQSSLGTAFTQMTQVAGYVPAHVWTTEALLDLHMKQKEVNDNNVRSLDDQRKRDFKLSIISIVIVSVVVFAGLLFMYKGVGGGSQIILGTMTFIAGFLAGRGAK